MVLILTGFGGRNSLCIGLWLCLEMADEPWDRGRIVGIQGNEQGLSAVDSVVNFRYCECVNARHS